MARSDRQAHWQGVYTTKLENEVSWFQECPDISFEMIRTAGLAPGSAIVDIGGGASRLVDVLIADGFDVTVLDLSEAALSAARLRLGDNASLAQWIVADVTTWEPPHQYNLWHDRAAFHFLTEQTDRVAYVARLKKALGPGGQAIIGTFAMDGPERCSGLPIMRYDAQRLGEALGDRFALIETRSEEHRTPWHSTQRFQFSRFAFAGG